jgi:hypothetical protein
MNSVINAFKLLKAKLRFVKLKIVVDYIFIYYTIMGVIKQSEMYGQCLGNNVVAIMIFVPSLEAIMA